MRLNCAIHNRIFNLRMSSALHCACRNGQTETALELIDLGADIDADDKNEETPLHFACLNGHTEIVQILIARGADISANDTNGNTPLRCRHLRQEYGGKDAAALGLPHRPDGDLPSNQAKCSGVFPYLSLLYMSAPRAINI